MIKKRKKSNASKNRAKKRAQILTDTCGRLTGTLKELAEGKTPPEIVKAHVAFYETCHDFEKAILEKLFQEEEDKDYAEITKHFAEKL